MSKMKPEVKAAWVAALRSGKYSQAKERLRLVDNNGSCLGVCCLGVLSDLAVNAGIGDWDGEAFVERDGDSESGSLPLSVMIWASQDETPSGRIDSNPNVVGPELNAPSRALSFWNDDHGLTFAQIADLIEAQL